MFRLVRVRALLLAFMAAGADARAETVFNAKSVGFRRVVFQNGKECLCEITSSTGKDFRLKQAYNEARFQWSAARDVQAVTSSSVYLANARIYLDAGDETKALETLSAVLKADPSAKLDPPLGELLAESREEAARQSAQARSRGIAEARQSIDKLDYAGALAKLDALLARYPGDSEMLNLAVVAQAKALGPTADLSQSKYVQSLRSVDSNASLAEWADEAQAQLQARQEADAQEGRTARLEAERVSQPPPVLVQQPQYPYLFGAGGAYGMAGYPSLYPQSYGSGQISGGGYAGSGYLGRGMYLGGGYSGSGGFVGSGILQGTGRRNSAASNPFIQARQIR